MLERTCQAITFAPLARKGLGTTTRVFVRSCFSLTRRLMSRHPPSLGLQFELWLAGTIVTETIVFSWPGIGRLTVHGISDFLAPDYPLLQAAFLVISFSYVL